MKVAFSVSCGKVVSVAGSYYLTSEISTSDKLNPWEGLN